MRITTTSVSHSTRQVSPQHALQALERCSGITLLILKLSANGGSGVGHVPASLAPGKTSRILCTGDWVGHRA
jgi:hypothetical protein